MQSSSGRWRVSPAIPTVANVVLAALWLFSAYGGWGREAFCGAEDDCAHTVSAVALVSAVPAALALLIAAFAWSVERIRRDPDRLDGALSLSALGWLIAVAVVFVGGSLA